MLAGFLSDLEAAARPTPAVSPGADLSAAALAHTLQRVAAAVKVCTSRCMVCVLYVDTRV